MAGGEGSRRRGRAGASRRAASQGAKGKKASPLLLVGMILAMIVGGALVRGLRRDRGAAVADASAWRTVSLGNVALEVPVDLPALADSSGQIPAATRQAIASARMSSGQSADGNFAVLVVEMVGRETASLSPDGAIEGAITNAARTLGSVHPLVTPTPFRVGDLDGYRASNIVSTKGAPVHLTGIAVRSGSTVWTVVVSHVGDRAAADAGRVLDSVRVTPPPAPAGGSSSGQR